MAESGAALAFIAYTQCVAHTPCVPPVQQMRLPNEHAERGGEGRVGRRAGGKAGAPTHASKAHRLI